MGVGAPLGWCRLLRSNLNLPIDFTGRSEELLVILISVDRDRLEMTEIRDPTEIDRDRPEIDPRSEIGPRSTRDRPEIDDQIWSNSSSKLLVGRRSCFDPPTVTLCNRPSSHDGRVHTTQKHRKPLPATLHHARRARDGPVGRNPTSLALRPSPTRRPLHAKLRLRALRVCSCTSKRPPRCIAATPNARRVGCHVCLELPLLYINSNR